MSERERQLKKAKYDYCKDKGICVICCKEEAFYNHVRCPSCMEKQVLRQAKRQQNLSKEQREHINSMKRERYRRYKESGRCVNCGKQTKNGERVCPTCLIQERKAGTAYRERNGKKKGYAEAGLCIWCGGERVEGKMMCPSCLDRNRELMAYARQFAPNNKPWERI